MCKRSKLLILCHFGDDVYDDRLVLFHFVNERLWSVQLAERYSFSSSFSILCCNFGKVSRRFQFNKSHQTFFCVVTLQLKLNWLKGKIQIQLEMYVRMF